MLFLERHCAFYSEDSMADSDEGVLGSSSFYKEIIQLPVIKSAEEFYRCTKGSSRVLNTSLTVLEYSVSTVLDKVFTGSNIGILVDSMVGKGVSKLKEKYPALQTSPKEIRECTSHSVQKTVRSVMRTGPGQVMLLGLDWALDTSEGILKRIRPRNRRPRRHKTRKCTLQKEEVAKNQFHRSEDSSVCDIEDNFTQEDNCQQTFLSVKHKEQYTDVSFLERACRHSIIYPLEVFVKVLRAFHQYVTELELSVEAFTTETEDGACHKITPSKSVSFSFLGSVKQETDRLLEYKRISSIELDKEDGDDSLDRDEGEKKKKHDETLTDEGSEAEEDITNFDIDSCDSEAEEDLANFDFDSYDSKNDPDYEPNTAEESSESDTQAEMSASDAESEFVDIDSHEDLVQLEKKQNDLKSESESIPRPSEDLGGSEEIPRPSEDLGGSEEIPRPSEDLGGSEEMPRPSEDLGGSEEIPRPSEDLGGSEEIPRPSEDLGESEAVARPSQDLGESEAIARPNQDLGESEALARPNEDLESSGTPVDSRDYSLLKLLSQKSPKIFTSNSLKKVHNVCV